MTYTREMVRDIMAEHGKWLEDNSTGKRAEFPPDSEFEADCVFGAWSIFGARAIFGERSRFGAGCEAVSPYWSYQYWPPFTVRGRIYPTADARPYWEERLGMKLNGCYDKIYEQIKDKLPRLLRLKKWTKCERMILESWQEAGE